MRMGEKYDMVTLPLRGIKRPLTGWMAPFLKEKCNLYTTEMKRGLRHVA
jgi:hypothetical protein